MDLGKIYLVLFLMFLGCSCAPPKDLIDFKARWDNIKLKNYKKIIPQKTFDKPITVLLGIMLRGIVDVDERSEIVIFDTWISDTWKDSRLRWSIDYHGKVSKVSVEADRIWTPDVALFNSVGNEVTSIHNERAVISSDGTIRFISPILAKAPCDIKWDMYPWDIQRCTLIYGSWSYNGNELDLQPASGSPDLSNFRKHESWELVGVPEMIRSVRHFNCCEEPYIDVSMELILRRNSNYLVNLFVAPGIILAILVPFVFLFPPHRGAKITLGVGIQIGYLLLLMMFNNYHPSVIQNPPIIIRFYIANMGLVGIAMVLTMLFVQIWRKEAEETKPPAWLKKIFIDGIGRVLLAKKAEVPGLDKLEVGEDQEGDDDGKGKEGKGYSNDWNDLVMTLDRIFFLIFLVIVTIIMVVFFAV